MNGRRIYHARGKVLGGSSSINGMIFQRGNPLDYERWAADPGMQAWDYAHCLPYFRRMEGCLAAEPDDPFRGHDGPLVLERGPATNPLFGAFFEAVQQAGFELTDDVNGYRQEGFAAFDRNIHRGQAVSAARRLPAPGDVAPQPRGPNADVRDADPVRGARAPSAWSTARGAARRPAVDAGRGHRVRRRDQLAADAPALRCRPARTSSGRSASTSCTTSPASARTCRITSRCTSSTRAPSRSRWRPYLKWRYRPWIGFQWLFFRRGPARRTTSRAEGSRGATTRSAIPT